MLCAVVAAGLTMTMEQVDLGRLPFLLLGLPLLCWLYLQTSPMRWSLTRTVSPTTCAPHQNVQVVLRFDRPRTGLTQHVTDEAPALFGGQRRFTLAPWGTQVNAVSYNLTATRRGLWKVGPLSTTAYDPLGLTCRTWATASSLEFAVLPTVHPITGNVVGCGTSGSGDGGQQGIALNGEPDLTVRDYRAGDDLRRIHWRSTARKQELMVRNTTHRSPDTAVIVVDTRHFAYASGEAFEWVVSCAASYLNHLHNKAWHTKIMIGQHAIDVPPNSPGAYHNALTELAVVTAVGDYELPTMITAISNEPGLAHVAVFAGTPLSQDVAALQRISKAVPSGIATVLPTPTSSTPQPGADEALDSLAAALPANGWAFVAPTPDAPVGTTLNDALRTRLVRN